MRLLTNLSLVLLATVAWAGEGKVGSPAPDFKLQDYRGAWHSLADVPKDRMVVVAFLGTECPLAKLYAPKLGRMAREFDAKGVSFFAIDSNRQDAITEIAHYAKKHEMDFPVLKDTGNKVADAFGALRTPEVFVLGKDRVIRFHGRVDDQYGVGYIKPEPTRNDLEIALNELLGGKEVSVAETPTPGCFIGKARPETGATDVTYSKQIARIFQQRCVECHREGEIAPFALTSYDDAAGWADTVLEVIENRRMPPWHANPAHGDFINDARLPDEEVDLVKRWVQAGSPEGNKEDLPAPVTFAKGWRITAPDVVCEMAADYEVPAEGEIPYQYFVLDPKLTEDKWMVEAECVAGNPAVVHHIIAFVVPPDLAKDLPVGHFSAGGGSPMQRMRGGERDSGRRAPSERIRKLEQDRQVSGARKGLPVDVNKRIAIMRSWFTNYLVAMAPGTPPMKLTGGMAKLIPAGSKIVFQSHYTPNGTKQMDRSRIGLVFTDAKNVKREVVTRNVIEQRFEIPPYAGNHEVAGSLRFREDTLMTELFPHMHLRGKAFRYTAVYPDGKREILLDVPRYDFGWQNIYTFREPKLMPKGTVLECVAHFDNSEENLSNPDPSAAVRFGDQTWEEMMIGFFNMARAKEGPYRDLSKPRKDQFLEMAKSDKLTITPALAERAKAALKSDADFDRFWDEVISYLPQVDRIDVSLADGLQFRYSRVAQAEEIPSTMRIKELPRQLAVVGPALGLYQYAIGGKTVVNNDPAQAKGVEMQFLTKILPSSVHIPVRAEGKPGVVNVWSMDHAAFPPESVAFLEQVVSLMRGDTVQANAK